MIIDLVLPCYNPVPNWHKVVSKWYSDVNQLDNDISFNLILVNDGSENITNTEISFLKKVISSFKFVNNEINTGKGHAIREGAAVAHNDYLIFTDIDFPYTMESFNNILQALKSNCDVALGYRNESYYDNVPFLRKLISQSFRKFLKYILQWPVTDTQCGIKGFSKEGKKMLLSTEVNRYLFDLELIQKAQIHKNLIVTPVNVYLREGVEFSSLGTRVLLKEIGNLLRILLPR